MTTTSTPERPLRADARRNRDRVLAVAAQTFAEQGLDVGVAEIARRAEVGSATLFRHFPTKEALIGAVLEQRLDAFEAMIAGAQDIADPQEAFQTMMLQIVRSHAQDRGTLQALVDVVQTFSQPRIEEHMLRVVGDVGVVLERAQAAGAVRNDVVAEDLLALCGGLSTGYCADLQQPEIVERYLGVVLDGLRPHGARPLSPAPLRVCDIVAAQVRCGH